MTSKGHGARACSARDPSLHRYGVAGGMLLFLIAVVALTMIESCVDTTARTNAREPHAFNGACYDVGADKQSHSCAGL